MEQIWQSFNSSSLLDKLAICSDQLSIWGLDFRKKHQVEIDLCKSKLRSFRGFRDARSREKFLEAKNRLFELMNQRELFWKQRAKEFWLKHGDQNTKFFHRKVTIQQQKNQINKLRDGEWHGWESGLGDLISGCFSDLFKSNVGDGSTILKSHFYPNFFCTK